VSIGGTLNVSLVGGFTPTLGQSFSLFEGSIGSIAGAFQSVNLPTFNGLTFSLAQNATSLMLQVVNTGDFNGDHIIDAADYAIWRKGLGTLYTQADYNTWRSHFGQTTGSGSGATAGLPSSAVPEPSAFISFVLVAAGLFVFHRNLATAANCRRHCGTSSSRRRSPTALPQDVARIIYVSRLILALDPSESPPI
jgi:hypothetical protein